MQYVWIVSPLSFFSMRAVPTACNQPDQPLMSIEGIVSIGSALAGNSVFWNRFSNCISGLSTSKKLRADASCASAMLCTLPMVSTTDCRPGREWAKRDSDWRRSTSRMAGAFQPNAPSARYRRIERREIAQLHHQRIRAAVHPGGGRDDKGIARMELSEGQAAIKIHGNDQLIACPSADHAFRAWRNARLSSRQEYPN